MDHQARLLFTEDILKEFLKIFEIELSKCKPVRANNNFIYEVSKGANTYILRVTPAEQKSFHLIESENQWIQFLYGKGINTAQVIASPRGKEIETVENGLTTFHAILYTKIEGQGWPSLGPNAALLNKWGALVGRMHAATEEYHPKGLIYRGIDWHHEFLNAEKHVPSEKEQVLERILENKKQIAGMDQTRGSFNLIHYDVNPSNLIEVQNEFWVYDFDDCHYDFLLADIASALFWFIDIPVLFSTRNIPAARDHMISSFFKHFFAGYKTYYHLDRLDLGKLNLFLIRRVMDLYVNFFRSYDISKLNQAHPAVLPAFEEAIVKNIEIVPQGYLGLNR